MADFARHVAANLQGTEEFSDVLNTPDIVTTPLTGLPDAYTHIFHFVGGSSREGLTWGRDAANQTAPTANHIIESVYFRFTDLSPTTEYRFFAVAGGLSSDILVGKALNLILETDGDVRVEDDADATIATINSPFTVDTWHKIDVRLLPGATNTGEVQIWVDNTEVLANQTGLDLASFLGMVSFAVGGSPTSSEEVYFAAGSTIINSTAASDRIDGDFEIVGPYQHDVSGAATGPDDDGGNTGAGGDALDGDGDDFATTAEIPFSDETKDTDLAEYDGTPLDCSLYCDGGGSKSGPSGDGDVDGDSNIKSAQYTFRAERGNGGGTTHSFYFGNSADAGGSAGKHDLTLAASPGNTTLVTEAAALMPLSTEFARLGFGVAGAQNMYMHEMVCTLLHVPAAGGPTGSSVMTLPSLTQAGVGVMQPSGTGVQTLPATTQGGVGVQTFAGSGANLLAAMTSSGIGVMQPSGAGAQTLAAAIQSGTGAQVFTGAAAQTLGSLTQAGTGVQVFRGSAAQTLAALLQAGVGLMHPSATGAQTLAALAQAGIGVQIFVGTGLQTLAALLQAGAGTVGDTPTGTGVQTLPALVQSGVGVQVFVATGGQTLASLVQAGVGLMQPSGTAVQMLGALTQAGAGVEIFTATGIQTLAALAQAGVGVGGVATGTGAQILASLIQAGVGVEVFTTAGAQFLAALTQAGVGVETLTGSGVQTLAAVVQTGTGVQVFTGTAAQVLPALIQAGVGLEFLIPVAFVAAGPEHTVVLNLEILTALIAAEPTTLFLSPEVVTALFAAESLTLPQEPEDVTSIIRPFKT